MAKCWSFGHWPKFYGEIAVVHFGDNFSFFSLGFYSFLSVGIRLSILQTRACKALVCMLTALCFHLLYFFCILSRGSVHNHDLGWLGLAVCKDISGRACLVGAVDVSTRTRPSLPLVILS